MTINSAVNIATICHLLRSGTLKEDRLYHSSHLISTNLIQSQLNGSEATQLAVAATSQNEVLVGCAALSNWSLHRSHSLPLGSDEMRSDEISSDEILDEMSYMKAPSDDYREIIVHGMVAILSCSHPLQASDDLWPYWNSSVTSPAINGDVITSFHIYASCLATMMWGKH